MTVAEETTAYSIQVTSVDALGKKTTRTIADVLTNVASNYMSANDQSDVPKVSIVDIYARAIVNLTTNTYVDTNLAAKTSTNDLITTLTML